MIWGSLFAEMLVLFVHIKCSRGEIMLGARTS